MNNTTSKKKVIFRIIAVVLISALILYLLQRLLMPKYMTNPVEGTMVSEYYKVSDQDFDVLFVGDCELYENISPVELWNEYGISSYIRGSAQQLIWQSYYLMEESVKYNKPDVIVFNVLSMKYSVPQNEAYNRMTLDYMKWSPSKVASINASMMEDEHFIDYVFPILRYHSRFSELTSDDVKYIFNRDNVTFAGYYMRVDTKAAENVPGAKPLADYNFGEADWYYLDKMVQLCAENDIELVLVKAPSLYPYWYEEWDQQIVDYAAANNLKYYNFLDSIEEIGLDFEKDTYDAGLHLNLTGAEKLADYFGKILVDECGVADQRGDESLDAYWADITEQYEAEIVKQCEKYGVNDLAR